MWVVDYKESWALKNWCFWTVVLEKTLESPLDCKEIQPVHPKGNQSWCSLGGLMLKLKLQCFGYIVLRANSLEKTLMLGKSKGSRRRGQQGMRSLDGITDSMDMNLSKIREMEQVHRSQKLGHDWATELILACTVHYKIFNKYYSNMT